MGGNGRQRRLAAILAADVAGYTRLVEQDTEATVTAWQAARREVIDPTVADFSGRLVKLTGDGFLAEFTAVLDAVKCAIAMQQALAEHKLDFRMGINLGDVIDDGEDIHGEGVNIAARLEALADPGGICISGDVNNQVRNRLDTHFEDLGEHEVKHVSMPVRVFRLSLSGTAASAPAPQAPALPGQPPALPDKPSIAVLPFDNLSGDPEQGYFADGITEDIITDLSKVSGLFVIARNSSFAFKDQPLDIRDICRQLGVLFALEGSVRKAGARVRINAQLIDGSSGGHLWAERYDGNLADIFALQDEVTGKIVEALEVTLTHDERSRRDGRGKVDPEAYDNLIRARECHYQFSAEGMVRGRALLERAIEIDPGLAPAYALLSKICCMEYFNSWNGADRHCLDQAVELAHKARSADEFEAEAYHALTLSQMWLGNLEDAERAGERAVELDPNFAGAFTALGSVQDYAGFHDKAIDNLRQALRLDPHYDLALQFLGRAQYSSGRFDDAELSFRRRLVQRPDSDMTRAFLAAIYGHTGRPGDARRMWREILEINPDFSLKHLGRIFPYRDPDWFDRFLAGLRQAEIAVD